MQVLTEAMLRSAKLAPGRAYPVDKGVFVTPAAREYARDHGIALLEAAWVEMPRSAQQKPGAYIDAVDGTLYEEKPEAMTHLHGNRLVQKTHPRIAFRGELDLLQAEVIALQALAADHGKDRLLHGLAELLALLRAVLAAEVKEEPLPPFTLLGMDEKRLQQTSHQVYEALGIRHPTPDYRMGEACIRLNCLRARVRQAELSAAHAFQGAERMDIKLAMNRLSSAVYILFCMEVKELA